MASLQSNAAAKSRSAKFEEPIRVVVVGAPRAGKTVLVSAMAGAPLYSSHKYQPSVGVETTLLHRDYMGDAQVELVDVSGHATDEQARRALEKADAVVLVYDGRNTWWRRDVDCLKQVWLPRLGPAVLERAAFVLVATGDEVFRSKDTPWPQDPRGQSVFEKLPPERRDVMCFSCVGSMQMNARFALGRVFYAAAKCCADRNVVPEGPASEEMSEETLKEKGWEIRKGGNEEITEETPSGEIMEKSSGCCCC